MYLKRQIDSYLTDWKKSANRKPLILRGARQVGKSSAVRQLGRQFQVLVEVNFEEFPQLAALFEADLNPARILEGISVFTGKAIVPGEALLFFDEIQACPKALASLRFFYEQLPALHVVAAGSLLEFSLSEIPGFGVGRVQFLYLYPFSFFEFLDAMGEDRLAVAIEASDLQNPLPEPLHQKALLLLKRFWLVGGMPECVAEYAAGSPITIVQGQLSSLIQSFRADFAKYKKRVPTTRISGVFEAVVQQSTVKFVWNKVQVQGNHLQIKECLDLLQMSGLVIPITHSAGNGIPLRTEANYKKQKMMLLDTGLFLRVSGLDLSPFFLENDGDVINKGGLAEMYWGLEYLKSLPPTEPHELFYWHREAKSSNAEVDYLIAKNGDVLPVEIKSSKSGSMQSLRLFLKERGKPFGYRFSMENYSQLPDYLIFPLYAVRNLVRN